VYAFLHDILTQLLSGIDVDGRTKSVAYTEVTDGIARDDQQREYCESLLFD
jgi:hypothetical protein